MSGVVAWTNALGVLGAGVMMGAYGLNQAGRLASDDIRFPAANLGGSALMLISLVFAFNLPSVLIEVFWIGISGYGIWRVRPTARRAPPAS